MTATDHVEAKSADVLCAAIVRVKMYNHASMRMVCKLFSWRAVHHEGLHAELTMLQGRTLKSPLRVTVQGNSIAHVDGLSHLSALLSLDLSCNRIMKVTHLSSLTLLRHLAVHGNQITSLAGEPPMCLLVQLISLLYKAYRNGRRHKCNSCQS